MGWGRVGGLGSSGVGNCGGVCGGQLHHTTLPTLLPTLYHRPHSPPPPHPTNNFHPAPPYSTPSHPIPHPTTPNPTTHPHPHPTLHHPSPRPSPHPIIHPIPLPHPTNHILPSHHTLPHTHHTTQPYNPLLTPSPPTPPTPILPKHHHVPLPTSHPKHRPTNHFHCTTPYPIPTPPHNHTTYSLPHLHPPHQLQPKPPKPPFLPWQAKARYISLDFVYTFRALFTSGPGLCITMSSAPSALYNSPLFIITDPQSSPTPLSDNTGSEKAKNRPTAYGGQANNHRRLTNIYYGFPKPTLHCIDDKHFPILIYQLWLPEICI